MKINNKLLLGISILCCCILSKESLAQYFVTKVTGRVKFENGTYIKPGSRISLQDRLVFSSVQDVIRTISPENGTYIFSPTAQAEKKENLFLQTVAMCTRIHANSGSLSGRGSIVETIPEELKSNKPIVIGNSNQYLFNKRKYPNEGTNKFFLEINVYGARSIRRILKTNNDTLTINYTSFLFSIENDDQPLRPTTYTLGFLRNGKPEKVVEFTAYFDVTNDLLSIISTSIHVWDSLALPIDTLRDKCYSQVVETIGKPSSLSFNTLFNNLIHKTDSVENVPFKYYSGYNNEENKSDIKVASDRVASSRSELPSQVSLRQYAPVVGNQGQTGTCTAWASVYAGRTISYVSNHFSGSSSLSDSIQKYSFSPEYIYFKIRSANNCDNGTSIYRALQTMKTDGNVPSKEHIGFDCTKTFTPDQNSVANNYGIKDFQSLIDYKDTYKILPDETINKMKQYLADKKAIMVAIQICASFYSIDKTGIWQPTPAEYDHVLKVKNCLEKNDGTQCNSSGHALCVVGYNNDINGGSFEVMNSWGTYWGNQGFFWMSYKDFANFGIQAYIMNDYTATPKKEIVLKGSIEFTEKSGESTLKEMMVDKIAGGAALSRGQKIVEDDVLPPNTTIFNFRNSYPSGTRYRMKLKNEGAAYVYVFGYDGKQAYTLFPFNDDKNHESPLIDLQQASLYIPAIQNSIVLDDNPGIENTCIIISKDSLNCAPILDSLEKNGKKMNMYKIVTDLLPSRIQKTDAIKLNENAIEYETVVDDKSALVFFLRMKHI